MFDSSDKIIRVSLSKFNGMAPAGAIRVDARRGWFTISKDDLKKVSHLMVGAAPRGIIKPTIRVNPETNNVVVKDAKDIFPCIHRKNRVGDTHCGGCGGGRFVEVFACDLHKACTISRPARDKNIAHCAPCKDRSAVVAVDFTSLKNKYEGKTITIVGRGETTFKNEDLAGIDGPILFLNDAVQLESFCANNDDTYFLAQDKRMHVYLSGMRSTAVIAKGTGLAFHVEHNPIPNIGKVCWTIKPERADDYLLELNRDELTIERRLYRPARAPTICSAIHFAWFLGASHVKMIRCDGYATPYAQDLANKSDSPIVPQQYPQTRLDAETVLKKLGMTWEYVGTPTVIIPDDMPRLPLSIAVTATETDAPGRADLNRQSWETMKNIFGLDLKQCTLYLNVDPVPGGVGPEPTVRMASQFFGKVVVNYPEKPDFATALRWCLSQPTTEYLLHFESDWSVDEFVSIFVLADMLQADPSLSCVNIRAYGFRNDDDRICLSPGLWRTSHAKIMADRLVAGTNPESQLRKQSFDNPDGGKADGFKGKQFPEDRNARIIRDIGRAWMKTAGYRRPEKNLDFATWEVVN